MAQPASEEQLSYIDYETFLAPGFDPCAFANTLVLSTNDPNDTPLDLSTPLSRVLFDIQEIDSHIDLLTARSAVALLAHTKEQTEKSRHVLDELEPQVQSLQDSYRRLEKEVIQKHAEADEVRRVAVRLWDTLRLGRSVGRCLQLGRQLEVQHAELAAGEVSRRADDHLALVRCTHTILSLRETLQQRAPSEEGYGLDKVDAIRSLQASVVGPIQKAVQESAERIVREFSLGSAAGTLTFAQSEEAKARTVSALTTLYLISPTALARSETWTPATMLGALESYLRAALQSSISGLARSLAALPSLERTLGEVSARCQNVVSLEGLLASTPAPPHPLRVLLLTFPAGTTTAGNADNLLQPLLARLETGSLASYFWRTLASNLSARVQDIVNRGGVSARTLRTNRNSVGEAIRECVLRGVEPAGGTAGSGGGKTASNGGKGKATGWDREVAVMLGSVVGNLGR